MKALSGAPWPSDRTGSRLVMTTKCDLVVCIAYDVLHSGAEGCRSEGMVREGRRAVSEATEVPACRGTDKEVRNNENAPSLT
jgi:hypothetical protein